ncbi:GAP family protein [Isoptericola croceus]|uniref:GAP family protein n=1 Tax=Isoptericola croceus TaxID=3031406 RepID=UPI0023F7E7CE|nr:GAP family protein [Isoptericola croceus]
MDFLDLSGTAGLLPMLGVLAVLALIDSTSFGTLLVPVWLLLAPGRPRAGRMLLYLGTVAGAYLVIGVAIMLGAGVLLDRFDGALDSRPVVLAQLAVGVGLFVLSFRFDGKRAARREASAGRPSRLVRWRERAMGVELADGVPAVGGPPGATAVSSGRSVLPLLGLAVGAVLLEVATMLPYLAGIGLITAAELPAPAPLGLLAAYCLVMILPALVLLAGRLLAARQIDPLLRRLEGWLTRNAAEMTGWVLGIVGVLLGLDALGRLGWAG